MEDGKKVPWIQPQEPPIGDIHSGYWEIAKDGMFGVANRGNGTAHKYFASAPYNDPQVAVAIILENGGAGPAVGTIMRQILDHIMLGDNNTELPTENPAATASEDQ